jgi:hypothetical protein
LLLASGCGLGDYEKRMHDEQARVVAFDDEDRALGPPLVMPENPYDEKENKGHPIPENQVFLRPPRGISPNPVGKDQEAPTRAGDVVLFRYAGEGYNLFLAGVPPGTLTTKQFRDDVRKALSEYSATVLKQPLTFPADAAESGVLKEPLLTKTVKVPPIRLVSQVVDDSIEGEKGSRYLIYFHSGDANQHVAVIYQVPRAAAEQVNVTQAIDFSLRTLGVGRKVALQRKAYAERKAYFPPGR